MAKTVIKEIAIVLLLIVAIGLILAIMLYDYLPMSKVVPASVVAYEMPNEIKNEIANSSVSTTENIIKTYIVDSEDLSAYESSKSYDKGKENPFALSDDYVGSTQTNPIEGNTVNGETTTNNNSQQQGKEEYKGK